MGIGSIIGGLLGAFGAIKANKSTKPLPQIQATRPNLTTAAGSLGPALPAETASYLKKLGLSDADYQAVVRAADAVIKKSGNYGKMAAEYARVNLGNEAAARYIERAQMLAFQGLGVDSNSQQTENVAVEPTVDALIRNPSMMAQLDRGASQLQDVQTAINKPSAASRVFGAAQELQNPSLTSDQRQNQDMYGFGSLFTPGANSLKNLSSEMGGQTIGTGVNPALFSGMRSLTEDWLNKTPMPAMQSQQGGQSIAQTYQQNRPDTAAATARVPGPFTSAGGVPQPTTLRDPTSRGFATRPPSQPTGDLSGLMPADVQGIASRMKAGQPTRDDALTLLRVSQYRPKAAPSVPMNPSKVGQ